MILRRVGIWVLLARGCSLMGRVKLPVFLLIKGGREHDVYSCDCKLFGILGPKTPCILTT
jgi:hypothetical protein